jgi:hypothetical protein
MARFEHKVVEAEIDDPHAKIILDTRPTRRIALESLKAAGR